MILVKQAVRLVILYCVISILSVYGVASQGYQLVWSDEFNYSGLPDPGKWTLETGGGGWGNNELQYYTSRIENAEVRDSILVITASKESYGGRNYTSARIVTYNNGLWWRYGKVEARIKLPYGQGIWPAFWMLGRNFSSVGWPACGEIDIMEMIGGQGRENTVHGTVHWDNGGFHAQYGQSITLPSGIFADDFHLFGIEWNEQKILWKMDETQYNVIDITGAELSEFHNEFFIIMNLAVGGNWPGSPDSTTVFPQELQVDYVRVYSIQTGMENSANPGQLQLYPNPSDTKIVVDTDEKYRNYYIMDVAGRVMDKHPLIDNKIEISDLHSGVYLLRLEDYKGDFIQGKIIKQ
jgi:beta-glucanase (GH16 family)